jgi:hypothetical protein
MVNAISHVAQADVPVFKWRHIGAHITAVFDESSPPSLNQVITLVWPYARRYHDGLSTRNAVARWVEVASTVPYSEVVGRSVVDTLLQISADDFLRSQIPLTMWAWLKKRPSLPPGCRGRSKGSGEYTVSHIRGLGDFEILKSYLLLVWSQWDRLDTHGFVEMQTLIREDFGGIEGYGHRDDLTKHLDLVQGALDRRLEWLKSHRMWIRENRLMKKQYERLKNVLLEVDKRATETLTRTPPSFILSDSRAEYCGCVQKPIQPLLALCLLCDRDLTPGTARVTSPGPYVSVQHSFVALVS